MDLKTIFDKDERGVSPVIGVILMVAITVILAAVIAAFVLDMGQGQSANAEAAVEFSEEDGNVTVSVTKVSRADALYIAGTDKCAALWENDGGTAKNSASEKELSASAGSSAMIHTGDTTTSKTDADYLCDNGDDGTYSTAAADSGKIQIIGEYDGDRNVITEHELS